MRPLVKAAGTVLIALVLLSGAAVAQGLRSPQPPFDPLSNGFVRPVAVVGEVNRPGTFPVINAPTLGELVNMAGGLTRNAGSTVLLVHFADNPPVDVPSRAELAQLTRSNSRPANVTVTRVNITQSAGLNQRLPLEPQDVLFVPNLNES